MRVRVERGWTIGLLLLGAGLCLVPLFDVLGYEWCLAMAVFSSLAGAHVGAVRTWRERRERPPSSVTAADARPGSTVARLWWTATARVWLALALPLLAVLANALRVRNCDLGAGIGWFVMLPVLSAATGAGAGVVVGLVRPWRGRVALTAAAMGVVVASVAWGVWRFYAAPPIFGYDPFVGYFAGTLYDEEVAITRAFLWARLYHVAWLTLMLALCARHLDGGSLTLRLRPHGMRVLAVLVAAAVAVALLLARRADLGFHLDAADIAKRLGGEKRTEHFVLHYSPGGPFAKDIELYAADDELRWSQLERWFGRAPAAPVHAFLFDNVAQKRALMGAGHTFIAKPWRREIYLQHDAWPQQVTWHELAHVFGAPFGDRLFGIARRGLRFNVGLIEGVAVAASWSGNPLTPHQQVKVLKDAGLIDDATLGQVMGPRFFGIAAAQAYAVAGSFCRFLADTRGTAKLLEIYGAAGTAGSWERVYGVSFDTLRVEWQQRLDAEVVPPAERAVTLERMKRPSVFQRACAHAVALRKQSAREAAQAGDRARALAEWDAVCSDEPGDPQNQLDAMDAAIAAGEWAEARRRARAVLAVKELNGVVRGRVEMALGDLALVDNNVDLDGARVHYEAASKFPADEATARLTTVKRLVLRWPPGPSQTQLALLLAGANHDPAVDLATLQKLVDRDPHRALYHYLLAKQLFARARWAEVVAELNAPAEERLPDARFEREAARVEGAALFRLGRLAEARAIFDKLAADPEAGEAVRLDSADWRARCDFAATHPSRHPATDPATQPATHAAPAAP
ncbi:MAG: Tetratricopeptide 4 [Myxococcales bacterium]|nr:Tetratricopeptide 4 [Myxococcales bacterium]